MRRSIISSILFDLDGTIIDSVKSIQLAFNYAYEKNYRLDCPYDIAPLIGPSIKDIFTTLTGETDINLITCFVSDFKNRYDTIEYQKCKLYPGMEVLLTNLTSVYNLDLFIVTNKRTIPSMLILDHLHIKSFFKKVYCLDSCDPTCFDKTEMVKQILIRENINDKNTLLVGDTTHDKLAAENNGLQFIYASYGFGQIDSSENVISNSLQIINYIN